VKPFTTNEAVAALESCVPSDEREWLAPLGETIRLNKVAALWWAPFIARGNPARLPRVEHPTNALDLVGTRFGVAWAMRKTRRASYP
jgi:hypothetical protein